MSLSRERRFAFIYLLLTLNALATFVASAAVTHGWGPALFGLFDVSAVVWLAIAAGLALLWNAADASPPRRRDGLALALALVLALLPIPAASSALLTVLAAWVWFSVPKLSPLRRASAIFFSLTAFLLWGRIALNWGAGPMLTADAAFVALIAETRSVGNAVFFADGTNFIIAPACSSLHGVSLAVILWTTVVQYFALRIDRQAWLTLGLAVLASILVNGIRLAVIARNPHDFDYWHVGNGGALFGWIALAVTVSVVYKGIGRAARLA
jgi:exosortase/archaeosortase family protein